MRQIDKYRFQWSTKGSYAFCDRKWSNLRLIPENFNCREILKQQILKFPFLNLNPKVGLVAICNTSYAKKEEEEGQKEIIFDDSTRILSP